MKALVRLRALVHAWTAPPPRRVPPPMRDPGELPMLRLIPVPNPTAGGPADVLLVRGADAFLVSYFELELVVSITGKLRDTLAQFSPHYAPADLPPPAEPLN